MIPVLTKDITPIKEPAWRKPLGVVLFVLAIPVLIIAGVSLLVFYTVSWMIDKLKRRAANASDQIPPYHLELALIQNSSLELVLVEAEDDHELSVLNEAWSNEVYAQETSLFRARTKPVVPALEGKILCFYVKDVPGGTILQQISGKPGQPLHTELIYLDYQTLTLTLLDDTGAYHLYNEDGDTDVIKGFNQENTIRIRLHQSTLNPGH